MDMTLLAAVIGLMAGDTNLAGQPVNPVGAPGVRASVLILGLADCPIARKFSPELRSIWQDYHGRKVQCTYVHVDPTTTLAAARRHQAEFRIPFDVILDPTHRWVERTHAISVPSAAVFDDRGRMVYRGRIDDRFADFGTERAVRSRDLRRALDQLLANRPVTPTTTPVIGCLIPPVE